MFEEQIVTEYVNRCKKTLEKHEERKALINEFHERNERLREKYESDER